MNQNQGPEGMIFAGKYRIVKLIGRGGMANVYLGIDMNTGINVAIKVLKPEYSADEDFIRRFDTEAKSVASGITLRPPIQTPKQIYFLTVSLLPG